MLPSRPGELAIPADAPARRRQPALTATVVTLLYAVAYLVWERNDWGTPTIQNLVSNVAFMPLNLAVMTLTGLASRSPVLDPGVRRALRLIALGSVMVFIGNTISTWYLMVLHQNPPVSWADLFYLSDSLLILAALLSFPLARRTRLERWKFLLDAAMVLVGGAVAIWYFSIRPTAGVTEHSGLVVTLLAFAYPLVGMLVLLGITTVILRRPTDGNRVAFGLIVGGIAISVVADLTFSLVSLEIGGRSASIIDGAYLLCYIMLIAGAELYCRRPVPRVAARATPRPRNQPVSPLPYLAVATTYGLLVHAVIQPWTDPVSGLAFGAMLVTALVVVRQLLAVRENVRLLADHAVRQNEARFRSLVQHSSDVIIVTRPNGTMRFVSPSANRVFGYDPSEMVGRPIATLLHPDDRDRAATLFEHAGRTPGVTGPVEWRFRQPDGSWLQRRDPGHEPHRRSDRPRHRAQHPRRERAQAAGGAAHPPGLPRSAHRPRQPRALPRPGEPRARAGSAPVESDHGPLPRPGRLQAGERQPGPRGGRPAAHRRGGAVPLLRPRRRHGGPPRRRRVRHPAGALPPGPRVGASCWSGSRPP